jgi:hypothetical protein
MCVGNSIARMAAVGGRKTGIGGKVSLGYRADSPQRMGTLGFLGGCVSPDGSVIRLEQADDGTIVGWQVAAPTKAAATAQYGTPYPTSICAFALRLWQGLG